jgi:hypothetical protein
MTTSLPHSREVLRHHIDEHLRRCPEGDPDAIECDCYRTIAVIGSCWCPALLVFARRGDRHVNRQLASAYDFLTDVEGRP